MKKLLLLVFLTHLLHAGSSDALMKLNLENAFGSIYYKVNTLGPQTLFEAIGRIGFVLDENQLLYLGKGGSISTITLKPSPYLFGHEYVGYEYMVDLGFFMDIGLSVEVGSLALTDTTTSLYGASIEGSILAIINFSQSIKIQLGIGQRYSFLDATKLAAIGLSQSDVDTIYYSVSVDIGRF